MKCTLTFICIVVYAFAFGQRPIEKKLWVGNDNTYLKFYTDEISIEHFSEYQSIRLPVKESNEVIIKYVEKYQGKRLAAKASYRYFISGDTLRISELNSKDTLKYYFNIKNLSEDEFELTSLTSNSRPFSFTENPGNVLSFRAQEKVYTDTINFQKIVFSSTTCYGSCPAMIFEIDNNRSMNFRGEKYAVKQGYYKATLPDQLYSELLKTLALSELDKLKKLELIRFTDDASVYTLEVHYNNKIMNIQSDSLPHVTDRLLKLLIEIPRQVELEESGPINFSFTL